MRRALSYSARQTPTVHGNAVQSSTSSGTSWIFISLHPVRLRRNTPKAYLIISLIALKREHCFYISDSAFFSLSLFLLPHPVDASVLISFSSFFPRFLLCVWMQLRSCVFCAAEAKKSFLTWQFLPWLQGFSFSFPFFFFFFLLTNASLLARDPPRMTAVERKCKCRTVGLKKRRRRNFIGFATDKAARERSALRACQATRIPARHPVCRIFVPVTIPISLAVDNSNFPAPPPLFQRQPRAASCDWSERSSRALAHQAVQAAGLCAVKGGCLVETLVSLLFHLLLLESLVFISQGCNGSRVRNPVTRSRNPSMTGGETKLSASTERSWARNEVTHIYRSTGRVRRRGLICMMIPTREIKLSPPFLESKDSVWVVLQVKWARLY